ncbi:uncharacterized protein [Henckelia pumila]|uniref:uncharacterized protein isoform X2 n=1 Tax=Henckelia pumila TaxID=405737 RepID=UPI003C6E88CA
MAVIEEVPAAESSSKSQSQSQSPAPAAAGGYESDGYETASETELNDAVPESENRPDDKNSDSSTILAKEEERHEMSDRVENEVNEKALQKSNDAKLEGNSLFKAGQYEEALAKYEFAIQIVQDVLSSTEIRSICHANRAACFSKLGNHEETIKECTKALELNPTYMKAVLRRAEAHEKLEHYEESIADMTKVLELDPSNDQARRTIIRLKPLADEKREKMKEEMIGKLKEMGNSILGRFGMSVDNFKAVKDPNTGSYSVSFQQ